jgi:hypothetical protein
MLPLYAVPIRAALVVARRLTVGESLFNLCTHGDLIAMIVGVDIVEDTATGVVCGVEP